MSYMNPMRQMRHQNLNQQNQPNQPNNFATDIHSFMDGLSRLVQILYSSIPVLEFSKLLIRYVWKFLSHLSSNTISQILNISSANHFESSEKVMDILWNEPSNFANYMKGGAMLALGVIFYAVYKQRTARKMSIEELDEFEQVYEIDQEKVEEEEKAEINQVLEPHKNPLMQRKSEEDVDRPIFIQENYCPEPMDAYPDEYNQYSGMY